MDREETRQESWYPGPTRGILATKSNRTKTIVHAIRGRCRIKIHTNV